MESSKIGQAVLFLLAATLLGCQVAQAQNLTMTKSGKAMSVFQVVRFPNVACIGTSSMNGTCYTSSECVNNKGTSSGTCANGFGVCCIFTLGCGGVARQNCTYFQSTAGLKAGPCGISVCKVNSDICQLRVDFHNFVIAGPNTDPAIIGVTQFGSPVPAVDPNTGNPNAGLQITRETQCSTDQFVITGPAGGVPPVICGTNSFQHVYVDASDQCNQMTFMLGMNAIGVTSIPARSWNLKITQISCLDTNRLAPSGCTQYYTGTTGQIQSFNFVANSANLHLANQRQKICFRRERGFCKICFSERAAIDFRISGQKTPGTTGYTTGTLCCNYQSGLGTMGYDCAQVPGASTTGKSPVGNVFCGAMLVTVGMQGTTASVCTSKTPFEFTFITDAFTGTNTLAMGFALQFQQLSTGCPTP